MIRAIEEEFGPAGNRAEFANHEFIAIHRVMIQDVLLFKIARIVDEIIVDSEFANLYIGIRNDVFKVNRFLVSRSRVNHFMGRHMGSFSFYESKVLYI